MKKLIAVMLVTALLFAAAAAEVIITGNTVNIRANPDKDSEKMGVAKKDEHYESTGGIEEDDGGTLWYGIRYADGECWVSSKYADYQKDEEAPKPEPDVDPNAVKVEELFLKDLITCAYALTLPEYYYDANSDAPEQYYNDDIILMGDDNVSCVNVFAPGYAVYGAQIGMNIDDAEARMEQNGLIKISESDIGYTFERPERDSCITVYFDETGTIVEIDWNAYSD